MLVLIQFEVGHQACGECDLDDSMHYTCDTCIINNRTVKSIKLSQNNAVLFLLHDGVMLLLLSAISFVSPSLILQLLNRKAFAMMSAYRIASDAGP